MAAEKPAARTEEEVIEDESKKIIEIVAKFLKFFVSAKPVKKITAEEVAVPEEEKATKKSDGDALTAVVEKVPATEGVGEVLKPVNAIVDEDEDPAADLDQVVTPETTIIEDIFGDWGDLFGGNDEEPETKKSENK